MLTVAGTGSYVQSKAADKRPMNSYRYYDVLCWGQPVAHAMPRSDMTVLQFLGLVNCNKVARGHRLQPKSPSYRIRLLLFALYQAKTLLVASQHLRYYCCSKVLLWSSSAAGDSKHA